MTPDIERIAREAGNKPRIFKRTGGAWGCIVFGNSKSRMGRGPTPAAAYRSWQLYNAPWMQPILDQVWREKFGA